MRIRRAKPVRATAEDQATPAFDLPLYTYTERELGRLGERLEQQLYANTWSQMPVYRTSNRIESLIRTISTPTDEDKP